MQKGGLFWGIVLLLAGILFLLDNLGFLPISALSLFFPGMLILVGLWLLMGPLVFRRVVETRSLSVPLDGVTEAEIKIRHGAGEVTVASTAGNMNLLEGTFSGGVEEKIERLGSSAKVKLRVPETEWWGFPTTSPDTGFKWDISLNRNIAYALDIQTGASRNTFDLRDLIITSMIMESGANNNEVYMPAQAGLTKADFKFGSASLEIHIPENVAARVTIQGALLDTSEIDTTRFPKNGEEYCSPDFFSAANKVEIKIEAGVGKVVIH